MIRGSEDAPLSPLDEEIETLLSRLAALQSTEPAPEQRPIREVAIDALKERLKMLSRKCTDRVCRIRTIEEVRRAVGGPEEA